MRMILKIMLKSLLLLAIVGIVIYCATSSGFGWVLLLFLVWKLITTGFKVIGIVIRTIFGLALAGIKIGIILYIITVILK